MNKYQLNRCLKLAESFDNVFTYIGISGEPKTLNLIESLRSQDKTVAVPELKKKIVPVKYNDSLKRGKFGILEPREAEEVDKDDIEVFFVPGTKFDMKGNRKGRGKGYFDKFLEEVDALIVGVCFENQVVEELKTNHWDVPVDVIVTERRTIKAYQARRKNSRARRDPCKKTISLKF